MWATLLASVGAAGGAVGTAGHTMGELAGAQWLPVLLDAALKGVAILALTGLATLGLRRASAAARHLVWFLGMVSLLVLPLLSAALPG
ncbi:MAG: hypothetical protein WCI73_18310, partial [Phycisphaerae bacterium]